MQIYLNLYSYVQNNDKQLLVQILVWRPVMAIGLAELNWIILCMGSANERRR